MVHFPSTFIFTFPFPFCSFLLPFSSLSRFFLYLCVFDSFVFCFCFCSLVFLVVLLFSICRIYWLVKLSSMTITGIQYVSHVAPPIYGYKLTGPPLSGVCYVCITSTFYCPYKGVSYRVSCRFFNQNLNQN